MRLKKVFVNVILVFCVGWMCAGVFTACAPPDDKIKLIMGEVTYAEKAISFDEVENADDYGFTLKQGSDVIVNKTLSRSGAGKTQENIGGLGLIVDTEYTVTVIANGSGEYKSSDPKTLTFTYSPTPEIYDISFIADGAVYDTIGTAGKEQIELPKDPKKTNYIFNGWYLDNSEWNNPVTKDSFLTELLSGNITVYAKFTPKLIFRGFTIKDKIATIGEEFSCSVAFAETPDELDVEITYTLLNEDSAPTGLVITQDGMLTGIPAVSRAYKYAWLLVEATAEGYAPNQADIYLTIQEPMTVVPDGIFEAEYANFRIEEGFTFPEEKYNIAMLPDENGLGTNNGYYLLMCYYPDYTEFEITSSLAVENAVLKLRLSSEIGNITMTMDNYAISINGIPMEYTPFTVIGGDSNFAEFRDYAIGNISLNESVNVIRIELKENKLLQGIGTGGPAIDCVKIESFGPAELSWRPHTENFYK